MEFADNESLYYASRRYHIKGMRHGLALRFKHGLDARWLTASDLHNGYGIEAPGAILSQLAARVDPYRMTSRFSRACTTAVCRSSVPTPNTAPRSFCDGLWR